ncbi:MAG: hypothetical protein NC483_03345, partial [Ruminococcus sp.]|nr:hypothetical protein [Ruminococcus sp.]
MGLETLKAKIYTLVMKKVIYLLICVCFMTILKDYFDLGTSIFALSFLTISLVLLMDKLDKYSSKFNLKTFLNALLFSIFIIIGISYQKGDSITYFFKLSRISSLLVILSVFTFVFYYLLNYLYYLINNKITLKKTKTILDKHPFLITFIMTLSVSIIYLIFYYPGTMAYDGLWQLDFYYRTITFSNHHPAFLTLIMGGLMDI